MHTLNALPPIERSIVELVSVFVETTTLTNIVRALGKLGHRIAGHAVKNDEILPLLKALVARGVLVGEDRYAVPAELAHRAMLSAATAGSLGRMAVIVRDLRPARTAPDKGIETWELAVRELRIELYAKRWDAVRALVRALPRHVFHEVCRPFDRDWVAALPADLRSHALAGIVETATNYLRPVDEAFAMLEAEREITDSEHRILVEQLVFRGRLHDAEGQLAGRRSVEADAGRALLALLRGRTVEAIAAYEAALGVVRKLSGKRAAIFPDRFGLFFVVALIAEGSVASLTRAAALCEAAQASHPLARSYAMLDELLDVIAGRANEDALTSITSTTELASGDPIELLIQGASALWAKATLPSEARAALEGRIARAEAAGLRWYAAQGADLLDALAGKALGARKDIDGVRLATLVTRRERWVETLAVLVDLAASGKPALAAAKGESDHRLAWIVRKNAYGLSVDPREQTRSKGEWSKGKPVALKRLSEEAKKLGFLTSADLAACAAIETSTTYEYYGRYPRTSYAIDVPRALRALVGAPNVVMELPGGAFEACEIHEGVPRLEVTSEGDRLSLSLVPLPRSEEESVTVVDGGPRTMEVVEFAPIHHAIARALGVKALEVPRSGEAQLRAALGALSGRVAVQADLPSAGGDADAARGDARPCFQLRALGDGLSVAAHVRPLGADGPVARPGRGGAVVLTVVSGRRVQATRDLAEETRRLDRALAACPALSAGRSADADFVLPNPDRALEALVELRALAGDVVLEWPDGEVLQVSEPVGSEQLRWVIKSDAGSFLARGTLAIAGRKAIEIADLADYLSASPGRFLQLAGETRYLALTAELRERLDEILGLTERAGRGLRVHPLAAPMVAELLGDSALKADDGWRRQVERFAASGDEVEVPSTFRGELRPYQFDGFQWMARLSRWGAGGCLADEMGLGKTIQAIALLLHRAAEGPALVVAPTSVVPNWVDELGRFAPTLRVRTFMGSGRARELDELGPFDLLVTSYSVLQLDIDALAKIDLATVVLDEAQTIKNAGTLRARAAVRLRARLRVATTGTPIENRLDDLHSIFSFLNPGLLGTAQGFQTRFVRPIERDRDPRARSLLRRLVAPFVLRRTKTQVVPELPARTEVTLRVPLEMEEMAIYEVIRQEALAELSRELRGERAKGPGRIRILAAIMRLRQAASNARLVLPDATAPSAKLAALGELLDDLLPGQHKVLVFSQFVSHLALVKEMLDARGVRYQYLDGATPMAARKAAVDGFQKGEGEVFLISLKAGGFGLNLTAADYVVHMDPWWNPAVEDQASDRAHRIGQARPVTIYRLVARDTIEDRILGLHHRKRELAAGILEGSDLAGRMTEEELLGLIRDAK
ncbi:MAG: DEAD/DEAH box helicase [Deltaproteobacteria bacterium]|nr:DEAD/DEAH box helicase [Deltaproteobacteria bacterium]